MLLLSQSILMILLRELVMISRDATAAASGIITSGNMTTIQAIDIRISLHTTNNMSMAYNA
jgi:hypothetical protein